MVQAQSDTAASFRRLDPSDDLRDPAGGSSMESIGKHFRQMYVATAPVLQGLCLHLFCQLYSSQGLGGHRGPTHVDEEKRRPFIHIGRHNPFLGPPDGCHCLIFPLARLPDLLSMGAKPSSRDAHHNSDSLPYSGNALVSSQRTARSSSYCSMGASSCSKNALYKEQTCRDNPPSN